METLAYSSACGRNYAFSWPVRGRNLFFAALFLFNAWTWFARLYPHSWPNVWNQWALGLLLVLLAGNYFGALIQSTVHVTEGAVFVKNIFRTRSLYKDEIKGRRKVTSRIGSDVLLVARNAEQNSLLIVDGFDFDAEWDEWLNSLLDLDQIDREQRLLKLTEDMVEAGDQAVSGEQRRFASSVTTVLTTLAVASGLALLLAEYVESLTILPFLIVTLLLLPSVAVAIAYRWPRLYALFKRPNDPRSQLGGVFLAPAMAFILGTPTLGAVVTPFRLLAISVAPAVVLTVLWFRAVPKPVRLQPGMALLPILLLVYTWSACHEIDTLFDHSETAFYAGTVIESKNGANGFLSGNLIEFLPLDQARTAQEVRVSKDFYDSLKTGDPVCATEHHGSLLVPWISVDHCQ